MLPVRRTLAVAGLVLGAAIAVAVPAPATPQRRAHAVRGPALSATIRRTEYGIPHIVGRTFADLGYGFGFAFAQDNLCVMAEDYVTVDAQRSRFFGPDRGYLQRGNGFSANNLNSDFFFQDIIDSRVIDRLLAVRRGPAAIPQRIRDLVRGYVAGYNRYLAHVGGRDGVPDPRCRGKAWVRPITLADAWRRFYQIGELASGDVAIDGIGEAEPPPGAQLGPVGAPAPAATARALEANGVGPGRAIGSNAVAVGSAGTRDHRHGLLLGNPHFPWVGPERFYQAQLTVPGKMNVTGGMLFGVPVVLIGHTATMAWSHTVSTAYRFTPYQLALVPGDPTSYLVDGRPVKMARRTVTVQARQPGGRLRRVSRTLYSTRDGRVLDSLAGVPLPWTNTTAFALRDANADNFRYLNHFFATNMARSAAEELRILKRYDGIPWVNTIVADRTGHALYADIGAIPHVTDEQAQRCNTAVGAATFRLLGLPVLDGSKKSCDWGTDPDSVVPGLFGPSHMPHLFRRDYVTNSNDSYWLSNPHHPLEGFARIIGDERTARGLRTRIGLIMTGQRVAGSDRLGPAGFTRRDMQRMVFSDRQYAGELTRDALVGMCRQFQQSGGRAPTSSGTPVPVGDACDVLRRWDLHENLGSRGAILFRRFWSHATDAQALWAHPFDPGDPVHTPNTLNTSDPTVRTALGDAIHDLRAAHVALDATVGSVQYLVRGGRRIPIHGGPADPYGEFNAISISGPFPHSIYGEPDGSSFVQVVTWRSGSACPDAATIMTYSLSSNPRSAHDSDQTRLFSAKRWVPERFCAAAIAASPALRVTELRGRRVTVVRRVRRHTRGHRGPPGRRRGPRFTG